MSKNRSKSIPEFRICNNNSGTDETFVTRNKDFAPPERNYEELKFPRFYKFDLVVVEILCKSSKFSNFCIPLENLKNTAKGFRVFVVSFWGCDLY